jgi:hypothetical protein
VAEETEAKVKVVDRRRFTVDGEAVEPSEAAPPAAPQAAEDPPAASPPEPAEQPPGPGSPPPAIGFLDLVDFLAQQAAALLSGQIPGRGRDPQTARFFIDLLAVVEEKTAGQLSGEEARYLEDVLYQLRSLFVAATR